MDEEENSIRNSKYQSYFILRGNNEHLARGELKALLEVYDPDASLKCYTMICLSKTNVSVAGRIVRRAGFIKEAGVLIDAYNAYSLSDAEEAALMVEDKTVHVSNLKSTVSDSAIKRFLSKASLRQGFRGAREYRLIFSDGLAILGEKMYVNDLKKLIEDSMSKPFKRSIALKPDVSRVLINLTRAREGDTILDPFAGTGSILIEAWRMDIFPLGVDLDYELTKGMEENLRYFKTPSIVVLGDSRYLTFREVEHVATDLPYGRGASTHGVEIKGVYGDFMANLSEYLSPSGYACFMTPMWLEEYVDELISRHGLKLTERYYDYVHGSLTRTINVVRKR